jgi:hypothetical protein
MLFITDISECVLFNDAGKASNTINMNMASASLRFLFIYVPFRVSLAALDRLSIVLSDTIPIRLVEKKESEKTLKRSGYYKEELDLNRRFF